MRRDWDEGRTHVDALLDAFRGRSWDDLRQLPPSQELPAPPGLRRLMLTLYKDTRPDGSLRIVIQQYQRAILGIGRIAAVGFVMYPDGRLTPVTEEEPWEYT
jgi:hypothetical protein